MAKDTRPKDFKNIKDPFERVSVQGVALCEEIITALTKVNGFVESAFIQINAAGKSF